MRRPWQSLDGTWEFSKGRDQQFAQHDRVVFETSIQVPFSPETEASGIADTGFYDTVWYRRTWEQPPLEPGQRLMLHFEAVDWRATVWVNGKRVRTHEGGYTPFQADITSELVPGSTQTVVVRAQDDPADLAKPRGKQDWLREPHSIWYPRTTGIWQSVWLETVNEERIHALHWTSSLDRWEIGLEALIIGQLPQPMQLAVRLRVGDQVLANDTYQVIAGEVHRRIALSDPGIDDFRNALLWSPSSPTLIEAEVELRASDGKVLDRVESYTALRSVATQGDRFILNGRPMNLRLVLDQGYWPETGLTPPDDAALRKDITLVKDLGFNGVRKHQKIESARFLYWADRMGLLVWEEMPSAYRYTTQSIRRLTHEWMDVLERDRSHPCIVAWVPFNESWGVPDLPDSPAQRHYVQSLYHMTKTLDPSRPVIGNDGWESVATDIIGIHDYDDKPARMMARYGLNEVESKLLKRERPGGRILTLEGQQVGCEQPLMITEFGGIAYGGPPQVQDVADAEGWGYSRAETPEDFLERYRALLEAVRDMPALAGFCYTQFTDTYQEINGLLYADRTPKAPLQQIARATSGNGAHAPAATPEFDPVVDQAWRDELMRRK
ncbi:glycoside hydrolase family 2 TIM barrel-domain containing protein [Terriglobus aquaticus]